MTFNIKDLTREIKSKIEFSKQEISSDETGVITEISDGIIHIYGLKNCIINELLYFSDGSRGLAMNLLENAVLAVSFASTSNLKEGDIVKRSLQVVSVPVGENLLGRTVNALGEPIDGLGEIITSESLPIEREAKGIMARKSVNKPLETGIKAIDSMIPIGLGQRELLIGDRQTGKTSIAISTIINQKKQDVICIYVAIGRKQSTTAEIAKTLKAHGAMDYTIIMSAPASDPAAVQYIAPFAACSIGEYFMEQGRDVLIIYDDLTQHAIAYRTLSLLLKRPPGREAYPGDVFYLHSRLLERAASLSESLGGGSMTAIPIIETQAGNISAYIPTNVISITDGQIFLESELFHIGVLPAINPGISVSRVGGAAQTKAMKKVSGKLKLIYSQFIELQSFSQFGSDLDENTQKRLASGERIMEILKQDENSPIGFGEQVAIFYALLNDFLVNIPTPKIQTYESELFAFLSWKDESFLKSLAKGDDFSSETEGKLKEYINEFTVGFLKKITE